ncbi:hypothetical protein ACDF64_14225 [Agromyces sp. MMS24-JH15]|uniref:hypothetical protein n=1 Tax=Agromyces sp. MMS24-JH15 TaxID=3243765 RepID=UPI0037496696
MIAALSIPGKLLAVAWRVAVYIFSPSLFVLGFVQFSVGIGVGKFLAVAHHRTRRLRPSVEPADRVDGEVTRYRWIGVVLVVVSVLFLLSVIPMLYGAEHVDPYNPLVAVLIATFTTVEFIVALRASIAARRIGSLMSHAIRQLNLANSLILVVLTQSAIMSFAYDGDASFSNGLSGLFFGSICVGIGVLMLVRARVRSVAFAARSRGAASG